MNHPIIVADVAPAADHHSFGQRGVGPIQLCDNSLEKDAATSTENYLVSIGDQSLQN